MPKLITGRQFRNGRVGSVTTVVTTTTASTSPSVITTTTKHTTTTTTGRSKSHSCNNIPTSSDASSNDTISTNTQQPQLLFHSSVSTSPSVPSIDTSTTKAFTTLTSSTKHNHTTTSTTTTNAPSHIGLSKGQKKRLLKREQYMKKERMILSTLKLRKQLEQSKRIDGLDAMKEALLNAVATDTTDTNSKSTLTTARTTNGSATIIPISDDTSTAVTTTTTKTSSTEPTYTKNALKSNQARHQLVQTEMIQMNLVLQHPTFQQDPLATIREHLQNSFPETSRHPHHKATTMGTTISSQPRNNNITIKSIIDETAVVRKRKKNHKFRATRMKRK